MVEISCCLYIILVKLVLKAKLYFRESTFFSSNCLICNRFQQQHVQSCVAIMKIQEAIYHNFKYNTYMISTKVVKDNDVGFFINLGQLHFEITDPDSCFRQLRGRFWCEEVIIYVEVKSCNHGMTFMLMLKLYK